MGDATYWAGRVREYGHTGWYDPVIYAYDQRLRLRAVEAVVADLGLYPGARCLDFGCGVGDFAFTLARQGFRVWAYDIADVVLRRAEQMHSHPRIVYTSVLEEALVEPLDLILCITTLQAVVDEADFEQVVARLAGALEAHGRILVLETFADRDTSLGYVRFRTREGFLRALEAASLVLESDRPFHHPLDNPTPRYVRYRRSLLVRLLVRLKARFPFAAAVIPLFAEYHARRDRDLFLPGPSPTEMLVFRRSAQSPDRS